MNRKDYSAEYARLCHRGASDRHQERSDPDLFVIIQYEQTGRAAA